MNNNYLQRALRYALLFIVLFNINWTSLAQIKTDEVTVEPRANTIIQANGNTIVQVGENQVTFNKLSAFNAGLRLPRGNSLNDAPMGMKLFWGWDNGPFIASVVESVDPDVQGLVFYTHRTSTHADPPEESLRLSAWGNLVLKQGVSSTNKIGRKIQWGTTGPYIAPIQTGGDADQVGLVFFSHPSITGGDVPEEAMRIKHDGTFQFNASNTLGGFGTKLQWDYHNGPFISSVALAGDPDAQGLSFWVHPSQTYSHAPIEAMRIGLNGNVGIGADPTVSYKLAVDGDIASTGDVRANVTNWPDYVFEENYELLTLEEVDAFIQEAHHLPAVPSEREVMENGVRLAEMNATLLQKIEEMTLYMIDMNKRLKKLEKQNAELKKAVEKQ